MLPLTYVLHIRVQGPSTRLDLARILSRTGPKHLVRYTLKSAYKELVGTVKSCSLLPEFLINV